MSVTPSHLAPHVVPSVSEAFASFCGAPPAPQVKLQNPGPINGIMGVISFVGDLQCSLALGLPEPTAKALAQQFSGFEIAYDSNDMADVAGELANVLAGRFAVKLETQRLKSKMSIPVVVRGHDMMLMVLDGEASKRLYFSCAAGEFWVDVVCATPAEIPSAAAVKRKH